MKRTHKVISVAATAVLAVSMYAAGFMTGNSPVSTSASTLMDEGSYIRLSTALERQKLGSFSEVYAEVESAVVSINTRMVTQSQAQDYSDWFDSFNIPGFPSFRYADPTPREAVGAGSGFIFHEDDENVYIVTNFHVVDDATSCTISLDDETLFPATYVGGDSVSDVAVISVKKEDLADADYSVAAIGNSDEVLIAEDVLAIGNALGNGTSVTNGIISAKNKRVTLNTFTSINLLQTNAAINRGNSGGPLVNMYGEVIGINTLKMSSNTVEGIGYAIPVNDVVDIIHQVMQGGSVSRPLLGVSCKTITPEIADEQNYTTIGVLVVEVVEGSPADKMGIEPGDIITGYNGELIEVFEDMKPLIDASRMGDPIEVTVERPIYKNSPYGRMYAGMETVTLNGTMTPVVDDEDPVF